MMLTKNKLVRVVPIINHYCHRTVFFVLSVDFDYHSASLERIYDACHYASFVKANSSKYAIMLNLQNQKSL